VPIDRIRIEDTFALGSAGEYVRSVMSKPSTPIDYRRVTQEINEATYAAWNAHDPDAVAAVFAENAVVREIGNPAVAEGRAAVRARAAALMTAFPDFRLERIELVIDGNRHADRWIMTGTQRGELFGIPPTGKRVRIEGATFTRLDAEGLVVEDYHFTDLAGLLSQLTAK
jgi:steroid delta-isomerase-like uncharacterized protein